VGGGALVLVRKPAVANAPSDLQFEVWDSAMGLRTEHKHTETINRAFEDCPASVETIEM